MILVIEATRSEESLITRPETFDSRLPGDIFAASAAFCHRTDLGEPTDNAALHQCAAARARPRQQTPRTASVRCSCSNRMRRGISALVMVVSVAQLQCSCHAADFFAGSARCRCDCFSFCLLAFFSLPAPRAAHPAPVGREWPGNLQPSWLFKLLRAPLSEGAYGHFVRLWAVLPADPPSPVMPVARPAPEGEHFLRMSQGGIS